MNDPFNNLDQNDANNPYTTPPTGGGFSEETGEFRMSEETEKGLNGARWALIVVGVLTAALQIFLFINAPKEAAAAGAADIDVATLTNVIRVIYGLGIALGVLFVFLGLGVKKFPLVCSLTGLILYVGSTLLFAALDPPSLIRGVIFKIIIVFVLFKAVQSALAFRREKQAAYDRQFGAPTSPMAP